MSAKKFQAEDAVICTWGTNKGRKFIIKAVLKDSYSCVSEDNDGKLYRYTDSTLKLSTYQQTEGI